jgi:hypothetical protein
MSTRNPEMAIQEEMTKDKGVSISADELVVTRREE